MFAWLGAVFFVVAMFISGGDLHSGSAWLSWQTLVCAGLTCAMLHAADIGPTWRRRG